MATRTTTEAAKASRAIKAELYKAFPGIKFSVKSENFAGGNSVDVRFTDGPTEAQVKKLTYKYEYGKFDGMNDIYEITNRRTDLPQVKYLNVSREMSPETKEQIIASIFTVQDEHIHDTNRRISTAFEEWDGMITEVDFEETPVEKLEKDLAEMPEEVKEELTDYAADIKKSEERLMELLQDAEITTLAPDEQYFIDNSKLCTLKCGTLQEVLDCVCDGQYNIQKVKVTHEVKLDHDQILLFIDSFGNDIEWLKGLGGTESTFELAREIKNWWEMTEEEMAEWKRQSNGLVVRVKGSSRDLIIDPQGYNYARYVGVTRDEAPLMHIEKPIHKGMWVDVYRGTYKGYEQQRTMNYDRVLLTGEGIPEIFECMDSRQVVKLVKRDLFGAPEPYLHVEPVVADPGSCMFGGNYISTSDSRFPGRYPIPIHDRYEIAENVLSR